MSLQADNFILQCSRAMANGGDLSFEFFQDADGLPAQIGELSQNGAQAKAAHVRQVRERSSRAPQRALAYVLGRDDALTKRHLSSSFFLLTVAVCWRSDQISARLLRAELRGWLASTVRASFFALRLIVHCAELCLACIRPEKELRGRIQKSAALQEDGAQPQVQELQPKNAYYSTK